MTVFKGARLEFESNLNIDQLLTKVIYTKVPGQNENKKKAVQTYIYKGARAKLQ